MSKPKTATLEFQIKKGIVDIDSSDQEIKNHLQNSLCLCKQEKCEDAVDLIFPYLNFEWIWSNCDSDPEEIFENSEDIFLKLTETNSSVEFCNTEGELAITASVQFKAKIKSFVESEELSSWLEDNAAYACGHISGGWSYRGSNGDNVWLLMVE
jgi:hypothetical protein